MTEVNNILYFPKEKSTIKEKQLSFRLKANYLIKDKTVSNTFISNNKHFEANEIISFFKKFSKKESDNYFNFLDNENNKIYFKKGGCFLIKLIYEGNLTENFYFNICVFSCLQDGKIKKHIYSSPNVNQNGYLLISTMMRIENNSVVEIYPQSKNTNKKWNGVVKLTITKTTCGK